MDKLDSGLSVEDWRVIEVALQTLRVQCTERALAAEEELAEVARVLEKVRAQRQGGEDT